MIWRGGKGALQCRRCNIGAGVSRGTTGAALQIEAVRGGGEKGARRSVWLRGCVTAGDCGGVWLPGAAEVCVTAEEV
ncbi:MAG: hypothetical protein GX589_02645 [Deltaproteobacteria bacterium]|nr:hypothetical protein [Deltaproteobacteria bacterium]